MEDELKRQLDSLIPSFELAQSEIHAETLRVLQQRFEKEKKYWENLGANKDEAISRLEREIEDQGAKAARLKEKIQELQSEQSGVIQQSFSALEIQKRSLNAHIKNLEEDLEEARKEILTFKLDLEEERARAEKVREEWEEKEGSWQEETARKDLDVENTKKNLFAKRETELDDIAKLEETIRKQKREAADEKTLFETEKAGMLKLLGEKNTQIEDIQAELAGTRKKLDNEKEERRHAAVEREKAAVQGEEDRKRMTEQVLTREVKIRELEESLERLIKERTDREESLRAREEKIFAEEEALRRRRDEWVESIKDQASQELTISEKSVDLLSKLETKLGLRPPAIPHSEILNVPRPPSIQKDTDQNLEILAEKYPSLKRIVTFLRKRESWVLVGTGLVLFLLTTALLLFESRGRRTMRAQTLLQKGNDQFTRGDLEKSLKFLEKAYELDRENAIIRNSLTLVLGELAHKEKREGKLDLALKRVEALYQILPEDPDVVRLHGEILQSLGKPK